MNKTDQKPITAADLLAGRAPASALRLFHAEVRRSLHQEDSAAGDREIREAVADHVAASWNKEHASAAPESVLLSDPCASFWFKRALADALQRDPVDAANEAEVLAQVLRERADRAASSLRKG